MNKTITPPKSIAFIANGKAHLPEIDAYVQFFTARNWTTNIFRTTPSLSELKPFLVEWHIMGVDTLPRVPYRKKIHEYSSVSIGKGAKLKNLLKKWFTVSPDFRIFQSPWVAQQMNLLDKPFVYRDMGVANSFFTKEKIEKEFDFVYTGSFENNRQLRPMIHAFLNNFSTTSKMLLIGNIPSWLQEISSNRLVLIHQVPNSEISKWLKKAKYGINYIPNIYPFNHQTSTKLLEYCACNLKIITTVYPWVNEFEQKYQGNFFKLDQKNTNFNPHSLEQFPFSTPSIPNESWANKFNTPEFHHFYSWLTPQPSIGTEKKTFI